MSAVDLEPAGVGTSAALAPTAGAGRRVDDLVVVPEVPLAWPGRVQVGLDSLALVAGALVSVALRGPVLEPLHGPVAALLSWPVLGASIAVRTVLHGALLRHAGLYFPRLQHDTVDDLPRITRAVTSMVVADLLVTYVLQLDAPRGLIVVAAVATWLGLVASRAAGNRIRTWATARHAGGLRTVVIGGGPLAARTVEAVWSHPEQGLRLLGTVSDEPADRLPWLGRMADLSEVLDAMPVDLVLVACGDDDESVVTGLRACGRRAPWVSIVSPHPDLVLPGSDSDRVGTLAVQHVRVPMPRRLVRIVRDVVDRAAAALLLVMAAPAIAGLALMVRLDSRGPAFYCQERVGRQGRRFRIVKLRTMVDGADGLRPGLTAANEASGPLFKIRNDPRVTRLGRWLRSTSLDELPQLWNVVRGHMSLVGPRPATPAEVAAFPEWYRRRLAVRPGITGLWQVSGRSDLPFREAMRLDLSYVESWSPWLDVQILIRTVGVVLSRKGGY